MDAQPKQRRIASSLRELRRYEWREIGYLARDLESQWFYHLNARDMDMLWQQEKKGRVFIAQDRVIDGEYRLVAMLSLEGQRSRLFN